MDENATTMAELQLNKQIGFYKKVTVFLIIIGVVIVEYGLVKYYPFTPSNLSNLGTFLQGTVSSVWALAGLLMIYIAFLGQKLQLLYQQEELSLNRTELEATRAEIQGQKEQMQAQNDTLRLQRFEAGFFELMKVHNDIINALDHPRSTHSVNGTGRQCFNQLFNELRMEYSNSKMHIAVGPNEIAVDACNKFFTQYQKEIGHYFRNLFNIIRFIDESSLSKDDKIKYANLVRAQLSSIEQVLLFYNSVSIPGLAFFPLVKRYSLVKNTTLSDLFHPAHKEIYSGITFEEDITSQNKKLSLKEQAALLANT